MSTPSPAPAVVVAPEQGVAAVRALLSMVDTERDLYDVSYFRADELDVIENFLTEACRYLGWGYARRGR